MKGQKGVMYWGVIVSFTLLLVAGAYITFVISLAKREVGDAPRQNMFICDMHGPLAPKYTLKLDIGSEKPIEYCSLCFHEKMKAAKGVKNA